MFSSMSIDYMSSAINNKHQFKKGMINEILSNKSIKYLDDKKLSRITNSLEGIRIRKIENKSKMENILAKIKHENSKNESNIKIFNKRLSH